ncbi:hypothetical protein CASFOL_042058 [Castilleja foliolosa]|uniref:EIF3F/CSN6-like C-terminal domain-containing protein n=1 Tax=Castilleja foliolosa TaxID=1961234 RepID=A0ABD3BA26_9LAMI
MAEGWQWENEAAGSAAGLLTVIFTHPIDVIRTRFQGNGFEGCSGYRDLGEKVVSPAKGICGGVWEDDGVARLGSDFEKALAERGEDYAFLHVIDGNPQLIFVRSSYTIETVEAERISVDHVAHLKPSDGGSAATQLAAHLTGTHSAIKMLNSRIRVLHHYLLAMQKEKHQKPIG